MCDLVLPNKDDLRNHLKDIHVKKDTFLCKKCKRVFKSSRTLKIHEDNCDMECGEEEEENEDPECDTAPTQTESQKKSLSGVFPAFLRNFWNCSCSPC